MAPAGSVTFNLPPMVLDCCTDISTLFVYGEVKYIIFPHEFSIEKKKEVHVAKRSLKNIHLFQAH